MQKRKTWQIDSLRHNLNKNFLPYEIGLHKKLITKGFSLIKINRFRKPLFNHIKLFT